MNMQPRRNLASFLHAWFIACAMATPVAAQNTSSSSSFVADGFMVLVTPRTLESIDADIVAADANLAQAKTNESMAISQRDGARANADAKKLEIATAKRQQSAAKANRNEAEASTLALSRKALERELELIEQRESLRDAEIDLARRTGELATLSKRALSFEKELAGKRFERGSVIEAGPGRSSLTGVILDLEAQTLEARVAYADKAVDVASRERRVAERQLKIVQARRRIVVN